VGAKAYSEDDRATALAFLEANKGNLSKTARQTGISRNTIRYWSSGGAINDKTVESSTHKKGDLAGLWEREADAALEQAALIRKSGDTTYRDLITAAAIATDKARSLRGTITLDEAQELVAGILSSIEKNVEDGAALKRIAEDIRGAARRISAAPR
jgi:transposase-like protein